MGSCCFKTKEEKLDESKGNESKEKHSDKNAAKNEKDPKEHHAGRENHGGYNHEPAIINDEGEQAGNDSSRYSIAQVSDI